MITIPNPNHDPALNLAMEEYILTASGITEPVLFYYVNAPSIIIGRHQNTLEEINTDYVRDHQIQIVRRCSGGGAVYHDLGNLNYSLIHPGDPKTSGDFSILLTPILNALHDLGLPAELGGRNDLLLNGEKFSGNAYYHNRYGSVTHGTLLFDSDLNVLARCLRPNPEKLSSKGIRSVRSRVCCIKNALPEIHNVDELRSAVTQRFAASESLSTRNFSEEELEEIENLANRRYRNDIWTYGESPAYTVRHQLRQPGGWVDFRAGVRENVINSARFFGDFFCTGEISDLESSLCGIHWDPQTLTSHLQKESWNSYFPELPLESFIQCIFAEGSKT